MTGNKRDTTMSSASSKREFKLLSAKGDVIGTYTGTCPYQAAMKAATKGHQSIMLREHFGSARYGSKVHMYQGALRQLSTHEMTPFAKKHNIRFKPEVHKVGMLRKGIADDMPEDEAELESRCYKTDASKCAPPCGLTPDNQCYYPG